LVSSLLLLEFARNPSLRGELLLVDAESNATREITITPSLLTAYKAEFSKYCEAVESYCGGRCVAGV